MAGISPPATGWVFLFSILRVVPRLARRRKDLHAHSPPSGRRNGGGLRGYDGSDRESANGKNHERVRIRGGASRQRIFLRRGAAGLHTAALDRRQRARLAVLRRRAVKGKPHPPLLPISVWINPSKAAEPLHRPEKGGYLVKLAAELVQ